MTIDKLPSGNYRVRQTKNGKNFSVIFDHKPTKREAEDALFDKMLRAGERPNGDLTFKDAAMLYVEMKRNVLSPNTVREYSRTCPRLPEWFTSMKIDNIDQIAINKFVNDLSAKRSPKTVYNYHGFISAVLGTFKPNMKINTTLPQKLEIEPYTPSDEDIKKLLDALRDTEYYIPICLGAMGLRRGEILALDPKTDLEGDVLHINKAYSVDDKGNVVIKLPKTTKSIRDIIIPMEIADMIRAKGYVYKGHPNAITCRMAEIQERLGMPHFSIHKLRHYFATKMLTITDEKTVQKLGGWKTDYVMKRIYAHSMIDEQEKAKREAVKNFSKNLFS